MPRKPNKPDKFKSFPKPVKERAMKRVMLGETPTAVAKSIGVAPSTVQRWCKKEGVERGAALNAEANPLVTPQPDHTLDVFTKEVRKQNVEAALSMFLQMQNGVEDKYRVLMAQQLYQLLHKVMQAPPAIRTWSDLEKAHKIMSNILNPNNGSKGGETRISIQLDALEGKPKVIDVEAVEEYREKHKRTDADLQETEEPSDDDDGD